MTSNQPPPLPDVVLSYPIVSRWIYQELCLAQKPLDLKALMGYTQSTYVSVRDNLRLLQQGKLIRDGGTGYAPVRDEKLLRNAKPFRAAAELPPEVFRDDLRLALLSAGNRTRFGHPPQLVYGLRQEGVSYFIVAANEAQARTAMKASGLKGTLRLGYRVVTKGKNELLLPLFSNLTTARLRAGIIGRETGEPQRILEFKDGFYTYIPVSAPIPRDARDLGVREITQSKSPDSKKKDVLGKPPVKSTEASKTAKA